MYGIRKGVHFPPRIVEHLAKAWHDGIRRPNKEQVSALRDKTGLSSEQIVSWFDRAHRKPPKSIRSSAGPLKSKTKTKTPLPGHNSTKSSNQRPPSLPKQRGHLSGTAERQLTEWLCTHGRKPNNDEARLLAAQVDLQIDRIQSWFHRRLGGNGRSDVSISRNPPAAVSADVIDLRAATDDEEEDGLDHENEYGLANDELIDEIEVRGEEDGDDEEEEGEWEEEEEAPDDRPDVRRTPRERPWVRRSRRAVRKTREQELEEENKRLRLHLDEKKRDFEEYLEIDHQRHILKERERKIDVERAGLDARRAQLLSKNHISADGTANYSQPISEV